MFTVRNKQIDRKISKIKITRGLFVCYCYRYFLRYYFLHRTKKEGNKQVCLTVFKGQISLAHLHSFCTADSTGTSILFSPGPLPHTCKPTLK